MGSENYPSGGQWHQSGVSSFSLYRPFNSRDFLRSAGRERRRAGRPPARLLDTATVSQRLSVVPIRTTASECSSPFAMISRNDSFRPGAAVRQSPLAGLPSTPMAPTQRWGHLSLHGTPHTLKACAHPQFAVPGHPPLSYVSRVRLEVQGPTNANTGEAPVKRLAASLAVMQRSLGL